MKNKKDKKKNRFEIQDKRAELITVVIVLLIVLLGLSIGFLMFNELDLLKNQ